DARARLYALSEAPGLWAEALSRWSMMNAGLRSQLEGESEALPERETEWLLYQTLLGAWPAGLEPDDPEGLETLATRVSAFLEKALREAKLRTRWTAPDEPYEAAVQAFAKGLLDPGNRIFLKDFTATAEPFLRAGVVNSLTQSLLKLTAPGVPDLYQGTESWDLSLVDPDNRRPVEFDLLTGRLEGLAAQPWEALLADWRGGAIKQRLLATVLAVRRDRPALFSEGDYRPLEVSGARADHVIAFARGLGEQAALVVAPRCPLALLDRQLPTIPAEAWGDTAVALPRDLQDRAWSDALSGESGKGELLLGERLRTLPLALLLGD
ncbi:MAG: malto-oligosyltrehalose synthase, partial [Tistlia sp.]